jgi:hypothetical protein
MDPREWSTLQDLWAVVYALHPHRPVAECVLLDAYDTVDYLARRDIHRDDMSNSRGSQGAYRLGLTPRTLWQVATYLASEGWERDQEAATPTRRPGYQPTAEDLLVRYLKTLTWWAMERRVPYAVVALGCSLYTYTPQDMGHLVYWAANNIHRTHGVTVARLHDRFGDDLRLETASRRRQVALRAPTAEEKSVVHRALTCFAPWTPCPLDRRPPGALWECLFANQAASAREERAQVHALLDPQCAGFAQLIDDYNRTFKGLSAMQLDPPDEKLGVPFLPPAASSGGAPRVPERFQPPPLSPDDLARLEHILAHRRARRQRMRPERLSVAVDGRDVLQHPAQDRPSGAILVPPHASYLQVYGHDADGPLLLAVIPLAEAPERVAIPAGEQTVTLTLQPVWTATGALEQYRLQLTSDRAPVRARAPLHDQLLRWLSDYWHPPLAGVLVTAADIPPQEKTFYLDEGTIRVTCTWWPATLERPAGLWMQWRADLPRPGEIWVRFTRAEPEAAAGVLAEVSLGQALTGEVTWLAGTLGFDPAREPWALALLLREPVS